MANKESQLPSAFPSPFCLQFSTFHLLLFCFVFLFHYSFDFLLCLGAVSFPALFFTISQSLMCFQFCLCAVSVVSVVITLSKATQSNAPVAAQEYIILYGLFQLEGQCHWSI